MIATTPHVGSEVMERGRLQRGMGWLCLALLIGFVVFDLLIATVLPVHGDQWGGFVLGAVFSQITLLAVWVAWAPLAVFIRAPVGIAGAALVSLALVFSIGRDTEAIAIGGAAFLQWLAIQMPLWIVRVFFGWRLAWPNESIGPTNDETQFGIRQLLAWTALVAITLGIARVVVSAESLERAGQDPRELIAILLILAIFSSLAAWPIIWAAFVRDWMPVWMLSAAACSVGICATESIALGLAIRRSGADDVIRWISSIQFIASSGCLLIVRFCGFRLVRVPRRAGYRKGVPSLCMAIVAGVLLTASVACGDEKDLATQAVERFNANADREAKSFSMSNADDANNPFELVPQPLLAWTNRLNCEKTAIRSSKIIRCLSKQ